MTIDAYVHDAIRTPRGRGRATGAPPGVKPVTLATGLRWQLLAMCAGGGMGVVTVLERA